MSFSSPLNSLVTVPSADDGIETIFEQSIQSSEDPPEDQWPSLLMLRKNPVLNRKMVLASEGLYDPGSGTILVQKMYSNDGQDLYLDLCYEMDVAPCRIFHRDLLNKEIDLKYYGVCTMGVRAMCLALVDNKLVTRLDLTSNYLGRDACYHLGQLLGDNLTLQELVLSGCNLGSDGLRLLVDRLPNRTLEVLDLSKNDLGDVGFRYFVTQFVRNAVIGRLNLSHNNLTDQSSLLFAEALECYNNRIKSLDISWNKMMGPRGMKKLLRTLAESITMVELNLSWNGLAITKELESIFRMKTLQVLDLSNNRLSTDAFKIISKNLHFAKQLDTLDISHNRLNPEDAFMMLTKMKQRRVKLKNLHMRDAIVTKDFIQLLKEVKALKHRANTTITYGMVTQNYTVTMPDIKEVVMKRIAYLNRPQKKKKDAKAHVALVFLKLHEEKQFVDQAELDRAIVEANAVPLSEDLTNGLAHCFPGPKTDTGKRTINLDGLVDHVYRLWPDIKLPPPPPPPPPPEVSVVKKHLKRKKKGSKK